MRFVLLVVLLLAVLAGVVPAQAQSPVRIETLQVEFWPEYDRPEMLVIHRIQVSAPVDAPISVAIQLPGTITTTNAVAVVNTSGQLVNAPYELITTDDGFEIRVETEARLIQVEYYDALPINDTRRAYASMATFSLDVANTIVRVQQPIGATDMQVAPGEYTFAPEADGLNYAYANLGALAAGEPLSVTIRYDKTTDELSNAGLATAPVETAAGGNSNLTSLAWVLGIVGLGMIGFAAYRTLQERSARPSRNPKRANRRRAKSSAGSRLFCHECGAQAATGDVYCRQCGTALRR